MPAATRIGLDIGSTSLCATETSRGKDGPSLTRTRHASLPPGAVQNGVVVDAGPVTFAVKELWAGGRFSGRDTVLGLTNPQTVVREMSLANLSPRELRASLPFQVRDQLPIPVERSILDFCPLEDPGPNPEVRGLLVAAPKEAVVSAVHAVEGAGLRVTRVDLAPFATMRAVSVLDGAVEAIVDIGAETTSIVVHADGRPVIVRTIPRGGAEITRGLAKRLGASTDDAEAAKRRYGLLVPESGQHPARGGQHAAHQRDESVPGDHPVQDAIRDAIDPLVGEIRSSFVYLTSGERRIQVTRLLLTGGGAQLPGLTAYLAAELNLEAVLADPAIRLRGGASGTTRVRPPSAVSVGLTLGSPA